MPENPTIIERPCLRAEVEQVKEALENCPNFDRISQYVTYYVAKSGNDAWEGTEGRPLLTVSAAISKAKRIFGPQQMYIMIGPGLYEEWLGILSFNNSILLVGQGNTPAEVEIRNTADPARATISAHACPHIDLRNLTVTSTGSKDAININSCFFGINNVISNGCIDLIRSAGLVADTEINNGENAIVAHAGANVQLARLTGSGNGCGIRSSASSVYVSGSVPGATTPESKIGGGQIFH